MVERCWTENEWQNASNAYVHNGQDDENDDGNQHKTVTMNLCVDLVCNSYKFNDLNKRTQWTHPMRDARCDAI